MRHLFGRLLVLLLLIVGLKGIAWQLYQRYSTPDICGLDYKAIQFDSLHTTCNTIFLGSSRTFMSLVPSQFDSLAGYPSRSYNYGMASFFAPHSFQFTESLLRRPDLHLTHLFVELSLPVATIPDEPFRFSPWTELTYRTRLWQVRSDLTHRGETWDSWLNGYGMALLSPHFPLRRLLTTLFTPSAPAAPEASADDAAFLGHHYDLVPASDGYRRDRRLELIINPRDTVQLPVRHQLTRQAFANQSTGAPQAAFWHDVSDLLHLAEARHIRLLFYLPNRLTAPEARLLPAVFNKLPVANQVRIDPDQRFDRLFRPDQSIDLGHLNHHGARQYTALFAEALNRVQ